MGIFQQFPYSNFHEMNLDQIIKIMSEMQTEWENTKTEWASYKDFIDNYFENLDVTDDVLEAMRVFAADGTLNEIMDPTIISETTAWLADHITQPTTPVIDTSLTIAGAGADAKTVGDSAELFRGELAASTDLNNCVAPGYYLMGFNSVYPNDPAGTGKRKILRVYPNAARTYIYQELTVFGDTGDIITYTRYLSGGNWAVWVNNYLHIPYVFEYKETLANNTDLDTCKQTGYYFMGFANTYPHDPAGVNTRKILKVFPNESANYILQELMVFGDNGEITTYTRVFSGGAWANWLNNYIHIPYLEQYRGTLPANADLNDQKDPGYYLMGFNTVYLNDPVGVGSRKILRVYPNEYKNYIYQELTVYGDAGIIITYTRVFSGGVWAAWINNYIDKAAKQIQDDTVNVLVSEGNSSTKTNEGTHIKVMSYNVANYNNDSLVSISDTLIHNLKVLLSDAKCDIVCVQEDQELLGNTNHSSHEYIFKPVYPYKAGLSGVTIYSKVPFVSQGLYTFSSGRYMRWCSVEIDNKTIFITSLHATPGTTASNISARASEYNEAFTFIGTQTFDYCLMCGDFNSISTSDKNTLRTLANTNSYSLANGGWLDWMDTCLDRGNNIQLSLDNVLCSDDCIINSVDAHKTWYADLYSDHYPLVADITLA